MKTVIRKIGNSKGVVLPAYLLSGMNISSGDHLDIRQEGRNIILAAASKPAYSLDALLAQCDSKAPMPSELVEWDNSEAVGNEV